MTRTLPMLVAAILLALAAIAQAQNCCLPRLADDDPSSRLFDGIQSATALLLAVPPLLVSGVSFWVYRGWRNDRAETPPENLQEAPPSSLDVEVPPVRNGARRNLGSRRE